jgi:hypothetical protein
MKIEKFEIDSWGCVKIRTYHNGRSTEHEYNGVPKKIILRLLQAKNTPEVSDFDGWVRDYRNKLKLNKYEAVPSGSDWWNNDDDD